MEFIRSCIFPRQPLWRVPVRFEGTNAELHECNCALMDKVNESIRAFFSKRSLLELTEKELEFLPYELLKRSAKQDVHLVWDKLSDHGKKNLSEYRVCERHPNDKDSPRPLVVDCWYCRAEREREEENAQEDNRKY